MKADQQTITKNLSFKTKLSSVAQSVFKWHRFKEKTVILLKSDLEDFSSSHEWTIHIERALKFKQIDQNHSACPH